MYIDEKTKRLAEIMDEEDVARVERGEKPLYQDEETFHENHPDLINQIDRLGIILDDDGF